MEGCKDKKEILKQYIDGDLDQPEKGDIENHLDRCEACASFVLRNKDLDDLLHQILSPDRKDDFLIKVRERISKRNVIHRFHRPASGFRWLYPVGAAAAAAIIVVWIFFQFPSIEIAPVIDKTDLVKAVEKSDANHIPRIEKAVLLKAQDDLNRILTELTGSTDQNLLEDYQAKVAPLRERGWLIENMLPFVIRNVDGPPLETALRLAIKIPHFEKAQGVITALIKRLKIKNYPEETMLALSVLDGKMAEAALGEALLDPALQDYAFDRLLAMDGDRPSLQISRAFPSGRMLATDKLTPFQCKALKVLAQMGPDSMEQVIRLYMESNCSEGMIKALYPMDETVKRNLKKVLIKSDGRSLTAGLKFACALRFDYALNVLQQRARKQYIDNKILDLIVIVGGGEAICTVVELFHQPVSKKERVRLCRALSGIFARYPDEADKTLEMAFGLLTSEDKELFIEMISKAGSREASLALAWIVENHPYLASPAALGLARTGSKESLEIAMNLFNKKGLTGEAASAIGAAIFHLGGRGALTAAEKRGSEESRSATRKNQTRVERLHNKSSITVNRFNKLKKQVADYKKKSNR